MKIIFDVGHPAQIHQFKHLYWILENEGWEGMFVAKDKDIAIDLLEKYKLPYKVIGKSEKGIVKKILKLPKQVLSFYKIVTDFNPDFILSRFSFHAAYVAKFKRIVNIAFADTEHTNLLDSLTHPLINYKITAYSYMKNFNKNQIRFAGNIELFYLHPDLFTPDPSILDYLKVKPKEKYAILRFVSWDAHHDIGQTGLSLENKIELVNQLSKYVKVFITSEQKLPESLDLYRISIPIEKIHDALAFAHLYIGEGGTMASESASLGTPSIYVNSLDAGVFHEEEKYGLLYNFRNFNGVLSTAMSIVKDDEAKINTRKNLKKFIAETINVTAFVSWFLQNYPESAKLIKENPDYQLKFK